jgi:small subunit ribosomal protein S1
MPENDIFAIAEEDMSEDFATLLAAHTDIADHIEPGQRISGTVIAVNADSVFLDVGLKIDGIMDRKEILDTEGNESIQPGDALEAWVVAVSAQEVRLSRAMVGRGSAALENARDAGVPVEGRVTDVCKGGYHVNVLGKTAFCPGSQLGAGSSEDADSQVGRTMQFLVTRVENGGRNIVVSHRALLDRERQANQEKVLTNLGVGDIVEGQVSRLLPFGAFVELAPGVEGMIHLSELAWVRVESAEDVLSPGDKVRVKVLAVGRDDKGRPRISLSRKQAEDDPWLNAQENFPVGSVVNAIVESRSRFGLFVALSPGITGLLPLSVIKNSPKTGKYNKLDKGDPVVVIVQHIDSVARRISLVPEGIESLEIHDDNSWKQHAASKESGGDGTLAQALRKAMQTK